MWRQDDLFNVLGAGGNAGARHAAGDDVEELAERGRARDVPGHVMLVACPLMHGTGQFSAINTLTRRRHGRHPAEPQASTSTSCSTRSSGCG